MRSRISTSLTREALLARFGDHRFFVNQLAENLAIDAELLDQLVVDLAAIGVAIGGHLRVVAARERADGNRLALDLREHLARRRAGAGGQEVGNVEDHEGQDDEREAPFEPALVSPHPVEHCHRSKILWETSMLTYVPQTFYVRSTAFYERSTYGRADSP